MSYQDPAGQSSGELSSDEKNMAMVGHLSAFAGFLIPYVGNIVGPLIMWQIKKDTMPFAAEQAKEALNFNITISIAAGIATALLFVIIGIFLLPIIGIAWIVFTVIAGISASKGENYRYPFTLRLVT